jgi:hypothetical protein
MLRWLKFFYQRCTRGWDDSVTWNLDTRIAEWILPRLRRYREITVACPMEYETMEAWQADLDMMIAAFEFYASDNVFHDAPSTDVAHGMWLFYCNYGNLWW